MEWGRDSIKGGAHESIILSLGPGLIDWLIKSGFFELVLQLCRAGEVKIGGGACGPRSPIQFQIKVNCVLSHMYKLTLTMIQEREFL